MRPGQKFHQLLDQDRRLSRWPSRRHLRAEALAYLASKFRDDCEYNEAGVNALLRHWHTFNDPAMLRRALYDLGYIDRTPDGSRYWRVTTVAPPTNAARA